MRVILIYSITRFLFNQRSIRAILSLAPILTKHFSIVFTGLLRLFFVAHLSGDRLVKGVLEIFLVSEVVLKSVGTVFAAIADTSVGAGNTTLVALAVLFKAARLLAVATSSSTDFSNAAAPFTIVTRDGTISARLL
jgi:hypothetical protein